jgi:hypothetical protein
MLYARPPTPLSRMAAAMARCAPATLALTTLPTAIIADGVIALALREAIG